MRVLLPIVLVSLLLTASAGCVTAFDERLGTTLAPSRSTTGNENVAALVAEGDDAFADRDDERRLKLAITRWQTAIRHAPSPLLATKLARAQLLLAERQTLAGHVVERDSTVQQALDWANEGLKLAAPKYLEARRAGDDQRTAIRLVDSDAAPALYWFAVSLDRWAETRSPATTVRYRDDVAASFERLKLIDATAFHGGVDRGLAEIAAANALPAPGNAAAARSQLLYDAAIAAAPTYLPTKVSLAENLCPRLLDDLDGDGVADGRSQFVRVLEEVIAADAGTDADTAAENRIAQQQARALLARVDVIF